MILYPLILAFSRREKASTGQTCGNKVFPWRLGCRYCELNCLQDLMLFSNPLSLSLCRYLWLTLLWLPAVAATQLHHDLDVSLNPGQHSLEVTDTLSWSGAAPSSVEFRLNAALRVETTTAGAQLKEIPTGTGGRLSAWANPSRRPAALRRCTWRSTMGKCSQ